MSYQDQPGGPYSRDPRDLGDSQYPPPPTEYPPPPGEEDERARIYNSRPPPQMQPQVSLPPISPYDPQYAPPPPNGYPPDPRGYRPEQYHPGPPQQYDQRYPPDYGRQGPPQVQLQYGQSAPRQRTAIACRYCRRRKIRCSGFEDNPTGKCQNCTRFQQDCIFTPVSSQAQAFVPAHAAYPHLRNVGPDGRARMQYPQGQQLYGAHGQPLGPMPSQPVPAYGEYAIQPQAGPYSGYVDDRADASRKRPHGEPQPSLLPPPLPGQPPYASQQGPPRRPPVEEELRLPPVTPTMTTPSAASSGAYNQSGYTTAVSTPAAPPSNYSPASTGSQSKARLTAENIPSMSRTSPARTSPTDRGDPMSLGSIVASRPADDIDRNMLGRLGRK